MNIKRLWRNGIARLVIVAAALAPLVVFSNDFYNHSSGVPATGSLASSATMRAEFDSVVAGFDKLPTVTGNANLPIFVNSGATALTTTSAATARTNLGLVIGTNVQTYDATLQSLSSLGTASDRFAYTTGVDTWAEATLTTFGRSILDDADAAAGRTTLGLGTISTQNSSSVSITGGTVSGVTISGTTTNSGTVSGGTVAPTTLTVPSGTAIASPTLSGTVAGSVTISGDNTHSGANTITSPMTFSGAGADAVFGPSGSGIRSNGNTSGIGLAGGGSTADGGRVLLYGSAHGSSPGGVEIFSTSVLKAKFGNGASTGVQFGVPTGGDKGADTLNTAGPIYVNNVAVPTISSSDTLSNKTIASPVLSGTATGTYTLASPTVSGTIAGSVTASGSWNFTNTLGVSFESNNAGSGVTFKGLSSGSSGPTLYIIHDSASPAANDRSDIIFQGRDSGGSLDNYGQVSALIIDTTSGSEDGAVFIAAPVAGTPAIQAQFGNGVIIGVPTGSYKGTGSINIAADIYKNDTAYTNPDYVFEHFYTGKIDKFKNNEGADDYQGLMPFDEFIAYTKNNLRLPGFTDEPSGAFKRADMALIQIETLVLYMKQQDERIKALEAKLAESIIDRQKLHLRTSAAPLSQTRH